MITNLILLKVYLVLVEDLQFQNKIEEGLNIIQNDLVKKYRKEIREIQINNDKEKNILSEKYES